MTKKKSVEEQADELSAQLRQDVSGTVAGMTAEFHRILSGAGASSRQIARIERDARIVTVAENFGRPTDTDVGREWLIKVAESYRQYRAEGDRGYVAPDEEPGRRRGLYKPTLDLIEEADHTLIEYFVGHGFPLTLRQLFYKLVTKNILKNTKDQYDKLGETMKNARYWGLISWDMLIDRGRTVMEFETYDDEAAALDHLGEKFAVDMWADQPTRVEVWVEKDAAIGTIERVCRELQVPWASTRGYHSTSGAKAAAERLIRMMEQGQDVLILHIADHDPSGWDMTRDLGERLAEFALVDNTTAHDFEIKRIALNMDQVHALVPRGEDGHPLSQRVKADDPRAASYRKRFGMACWELDALEPTDLADIIRRPVVEVLDVNRWNAALDRERRARTDLGRVGKSWGAVVGSLNGQAVWDRN